MKYEEVSRTKLEGNSRLTPWEKWDTTRLTKAQSSYLRVACLDAVRHGVDRCQSVQAYVNGLGVGSVPAPVATRTVELRKSGYHGYEYFDVLRRRTGYTEANVRGALNALIRAGQVERTRGDKRGKPSNTHYHIAEELTDRQRREIADRELDKVTMGNLEKMLKALGISAVVDGCETTPISIHLGTIAAVKLLRILEIARDAL